MNRRRLKLLKLAARSAESFRVFGEDARLAYELSVAKLLDAAVGSGESGLEGIVYGITIEGREKLAERNAWWKHLVAVAVQTGISTAIAAVVASIVGSCRVDSRIGEVLGGAPVEETRNQP